MNIDLQRYWGERELFFVGELSAKIIDSMNRDGTATLFSKESKSCQVSGLYNLLDQLSNYYNWDKSKIIIKTSNYIECHDHYTIEPLFEEMMEYAFYDKEYPRCKLEPRPWNHEKTYGMFLGRANVTRIHAIHAHKKFEFQDQGLVSWHHNLREQVDLPVLAEYLMTTNQTYEEMISIPPYSDIGSVVTPPITGFAQGGVDWYSVYEKIGIELVFETAEVAEATSLTAKLWRPMLFKRPFMLIGGRHAIKNIKETVVPNIIQRIDPSLDFCFFPDVISNAYDEDFGIYRVDHVFDILRELILTKKINTILEDCKEGIELNYKTAQKVLNNQYAMAPNKSPIWDFESWKKPKF